MVHSSETSQKLPKFGDRRYRLNGDEVDPVMQLVKERLTELLEDRVNLEEATVLYRILWRHREYSVGRPFYPDPITWGHIEALLNNGPIAEDCRKLQIPDARLSSGNFPDECLPDASEKMAKNVPKAI